MDANCIFCRIVGGQIPSTKVYEDEDLIVFKDIHPKAPIHLLLVPRVHVESLMTVQPQHGPLVSRMLFLAPRLAREQGAADGFRVVINNGPGGGQEVFHLHMHVLAGPRPWKQSF
ncbi:MAG TPA: histidine triad nucleotide-binding protein [Burkholderiaceae bacterium]|jgi:histidine triad (HIT) family protein|nr:histidine triad nucleotide-binding protein [Burkholderiaceae bacterium]